MAAVAVCGLGLACAAFLLPVHVDDAYIAYRYAANVAEGSGIVFNPGTPPVEGFSSWTWLAVLSAVARADDPASLPDFAPALGALGLLAALGVSLGTLWRDSRASAVLAAALLAVLPTAALYAVSGLETTWFLALSLGWTASCLGRLPLAFGVACGILACPTRPEWPMFLPVLLACRIVAPEHAEANVLRRLALALGVSGAVVVIARALVFDSLLPQPFYAKPPWVMGGLAYVGDLMLSGAPALLVALALVGAVVGGPVHRAFAFVGFGWLGAAVIEGGDHMPLGRLALPGLAHLAIAAAGSTVPWSGTRASRIALGVALLLYAGLAGRQLLVTRAAQRYEAVLHYENDVLGRSLERLGHRTVALVDIGRVGFGRKLNIVDLAGLTDRRIGRAPGTHLRKELDLSYLFDERRPDAIVLRIAAPPQRLTGRDVRYLPNSPVEAAISADPRLARDYVLASTLVPDTPRDPYYGRLVFTRRTP